MDEQRKAREKIAKPQPAQLTTIHVHPGGVAIVININRDAIVKVIYAAPARASRKRETKTTGRGRRHEATTIFLVFFRHIGVG
jgi:hypothetical protein